MASNEGKAEESAQLFTSPSSEVKCGGCDRTDKHCVDCAEGSQVYKVLGKLPLIVSI